MLELVCRTIKPTRIKGYFGKHYVFDWNMSKRIKDTSFTHHSVRGTHKIQLLKYSCNVQRAFAVKLSLKSKHEAEKKRELGNRHLMYVLTLLNTLNIQAHQRVQTMVNREAGKPG